MTYLSENDSIFSSIYLDGRAKEERVYSDLEVAKLPDTSEVNINYTEWQMRIKSTNRIIQYLKLKKIPLSILDLVCGNGWFSNKLSDISATDVYGVDINDLELTKTARVFVRDNLKFVYLDIFSEEAKRLPRFDIIIINSSIQYFDDLDNILKCLKS